MTASGPKTLAERLFEQRVVVLHGALDDTVANRVSAELMTLDAEGDGPVTLRIDSADGSVALALTLMDVIELLGVPVHALCMGQVGGPAVGVLSVCTHRASMPSTRFSLREPTTQMRGAGARGGAVGAAAGRRAAAVPRPRGGCGREAGGLGGRALRRRHLHERPGGVGLRAARRDLPAPGRRSTRCRDRRSGSGPSLTRAGIDVPTMRYDRRPTPHRAPPLRSMG